MTIIRGTRPGDEFLVLLQDAAQDERISLRALGTLVTVLSRPPDWEPSVNSIARNRPEGRDAVAVAVDELELYGYLHRRRKRSAKGQWWGWEWHLSDRPNTENQESVRQRLANRKSGRRKSVDPASADQVSTNPVSVDPVSVDPVSTDPVSTDPVSPGPASTDPASTDPASTDPASTDPASTDQGCPKEETQRGDTPPPTPALDGREAGEVLEDVVVGGLQRIGTPVPATRTLRAECRRLALAGWRPEQLREAIREHDWTGARAGAVVAWLRDQLEPPAAAVTPLPRPMTPCPDHPEHPAGRCSLCEAMAVPSPGLLRPVEV